MLVYEGPLIGKPVENKESGAPTNVLSGSTLSGIITKPRFRDDETGVWKGEVTASLVSQVTLKERPRQEARSLRVQD